MMTAKLISIRVEPNSDKIELIVQFDNDVYKCLIALIFEVVQGIVPDDEFERMIQNHSWATKQIVNYVFRHLDGEEIEFPALLEDKLY